MRNAYRTLILKPERRGPFGKPMLIWEDNIKMDINRGWEGVDSIHVDQYMDQ
jgi:hypothetical protein